MGAVSSTRRLTVDGVNVYYEHYQNPGRQTLVCIHGFLSSAFSFRKVIPLLRDRYDIIALDLPPFGQSEKSRTFIYTYQNLANLVIGILEHLQVKQAALVGHSMGGQISLAAALQSRSFFQRLCCFAVQGI